jgi:hypothetical protein
VLVILSLSWGFGRWLGERILGQEDIEGEGGGGDEFWMKDD